MQETLVLSLIQEDPTWHRAAEPMLHTYWLSSGAQESQLLKPVHPGAQQDKPLQWEGRATQPEGSPRSPNLGKGPHSNKEQAPKAAKTEMNN